MKTLRLREERGSALLLVVFMVLVFTILGVAVMGATLGGAKRSETRENDVQSLHLAERALNEAAAEIALKFDKKEGAIDLEHLSSDLEEIKVKINNDAKTTSGLEGASGRILEFELPSDTAQKSKPEVVENVEVTIKVKAEAEVNGVRRVLVQDITLDSYPEFLKYAAGSESSVYLNGAPYIIGDFYSGLNLRVKNQADYIYNHLASEPQQYMMTQFPTLDGTVYVQNNESIKTCMSTSYCDFLNEAEYSPIDLDKANSATQVKTAINNSIENVKYRDKNKFVSINIEESFLDKLAEALGASKTDRDNYPVLDDLSEISKGSNKARNFIRANMKPLTTLQVKPTPPKNPTNEQYEDFLSKMESYLSSFSKGSQLEKTKIYDGNLTINGNELKQLRFNPDFKNSRTKNGTYMQSNWLIVNGDLIIDNQMGASDPQTKPVPLEILGNILVNGDVVVKGRVEMDATIIALGKATIQDAEIAGLKVAGKEKELLLMTKGQIFINRVDSFNKINAPFDPDLTKDNQGSNNPPMLKAFFYTDSNLELEPDAELYGVGSAFWIRGGFFAKGDLVINAVLGNTEEPAENDKSLKPDEMNLIPMEPRDKGSEPKENDYKRLRSRFIIQYYDQIYVDQNVGLPRVKTINMRVGKKHFDDE
ncbi:hypothetical protein [Cohnella sp. GbtcB17]|uniref:hypothetical protein n=1 Tax=Cohnella sp. GbtcB17 TaxID=2824762 RepID=UPI001C2F30AB|nr:hypothetical protein [Cohnella sp. GbtcB17]